MKLRKIFENNTTEKNDIRNIENDTESNNHFRKVLFTGENIQLVVMSLKPESEIGEESHDDTDQFFRIESGEGYVILDDKSTPIHDGDTIIVTKGTKHNIRNTSIDKPLKLYTIYSPPHHKPGTINKENPDGLHSR